MTWSSRGLERSCTDAQPWSSARIEDKKLSAPENKAFWEPHWLPEHEPAQE